MKIPKIRVTCSSCNFLGKLSEWIWRVRPGTVSSFEAICPRCNKHTATWLTTFGDYED